MLSVNATLVAGHPAMRLGLRGAARHKAGRVQRFFESVQGGKGKVICNSKETRVFEHELSFYGLAGANRRTGGMHA
jgi:hypothetical protein